MGVSDTLSKLSKAMLTSKYRPYPVQSTESLHCSEGDGTKKTVQMEMHNFTEDRRRPCSRYLPYFTWQENSELHF